MRNILVFVVAGIIGAMSGCATAPVAINQPVGPNPFIASSGGGAGKLKVYTAKEEENDVGFETPYFQRSAYTIYDSNGREIKHVNDNNKSEFQPLPRTVELPPGTYRVKALTAVGFGELVVVPVVIEAGRMTEVHLNGQWRPSSNVPEHELVLAPAGFPIGWRAASQKQ